MGNILFVDFGSTFTKLIAADMENEKIVATASTRTTSQTDIYEGFLIALGKIQKQVHRFSYDKMYACSSAAGGLRIVAAGLVPELTAEAARLAALGAGGKVLKTYSYELTSKDVQEISDLNPDIFLLCGGTDGGNKATVIHNANVISEINTSFPVIYAGNKSAAETVVSVLLNKGIEVFECENVMPEFGVLNIEPVKAKIRELFLKRIVKARGLTRINKIIDGILMPTPSAVLLAVSLISTGSGQEKGIGDLIAMDIGGATTDIFSICDGRPKNAGVILKGIQEPVEKRTVEGDLGVSYSAFSTLEMIGLDKFSEAIGLERATVLSCIKNMQNNCQFDCEYEYNMEKVKHGLASAAAELAVDRHAGRISEHYSPMGPVYVQTGKDLTNVSTIIGIGGVLVHSKNPSDILAKALFNQGTPNILKPYKANMYIDRKYIMAAMGMAGLYWPEKAIRIIKKELELIA
jgi:uncharacterized protein (TIGR01319 family)